MWHLAVSEKADRPGDVRELWIFWGNYRTKRELVAAIAELPRTVQHWRVADKNGYPVAALSGSRSA